MPLEVIGAGCSRTGTYSLYLALEILGYKTHHGFSLLTDPSQDPNIWLDAHMNSTSQNCYNNSNKDGDDEDKWEKVYGNYTAASDWPTSSFYKQLLKQYPAAKVILTVRPAESWYTSIENTVLKLVRWRFMRYVLPHHLWLVQDLWCRTFLNGAVADSEDSSPLFDRDNMIRCYNQHIEEVKQTIPEDQLLIMSFDDGWEPLCKFLGKEVPPSNVPYPNSNARLNFYEFFWRPMQKEWGNTLGMRCWWGLWRLCEYKKSRLSSSSPIIVCIVVIVVYVISLFLYHQFSSL
ncbi:P-loop containing nucleoside triphosphate hydrolase protein [Zychaea mexicana]|uniref:P-loop containing nucleoside triphosphate hydrolase protein n=1 Tax=Zychaea mexicana TaxID=64656 RepID=UPI0022FECB45|nr:P-loop containing nucleoside triphosphate hydrolase protein [Zychaea mexicana]KAI9496467.1 P-loop containing nucleoside triphosphate hydrolase protein [Zychaea mexicana]